MDKISDKDRFDNLSHWIVNKWQSKRGGVIQISKFALAYLVGSIGYRWYQQEPQVWTASQTGVVIVFLLMVLIEFLRPP